MWRRRFRRPQRSTLSARFRVLPAAAPKSAANGCGGAAERYGSADAFFQRYFVLNYCPLVFMEAGGRNRTPDKLPRAERDALYGICDEALRSAIQALQPSALIGIGRFAHDKLDKVLGDERPPLYLAPHPSPASPVANRGWAPLMDAVVDAMA